MEDRHATLKAQSPVNVAWRGPQTILHKHNNGARRRSGQGAKGFGAERAASGWQWRRAPTALSHHEFVSIGRLIKPRVSIYDI